MHLVALSPHRVGVPGAPLRSVTCLTCGGECTYSEASFSPSGAYYVQKCLGPGVPFNVLYSLPRPDNGELNTGVNYLTNICGLKLLLGAYYVQKCLGPGVPFNVLYSLPRPDNGELNTGVNNLTNICGLKLLLGAYYVQKCLGPGVPYNVLYSLPRPDNGER